MRTQSASEVTVLPIDPPSAAASRRALRTGTTVLLGGLIAEYVVTAFHASHEAPNDHQAVFAEYAASDNWIIVHFGQFAAGLLIIFGIVALFRALQPAAGPSLLTRAGEGAAILTASVSAVLQGIDGIALKHAVDSLARVEPQMHQAAFHDTEIVRWIEWAMAGYFRITLGLTVVLVGLAVARSRILPRWTAPLAVLAGLAFITDGVDVSTNGFTGATLANLTSWVALILFAGSTAVAAWWGRNKTNPQS